MLMQSSRANDPVKSSAADDTTAAERAWTVGHARAFIVGLVVALVGFWMPVVFGWYLWATHA
ncbi:hypothetical protein [Microbacterium sp. T32]|uniref:hypothetical protein n=1 Tax=Microbacterium sp. T32 TaxID=1776083 RepID=UPI0007ABBE92|nr:hypothetical protein [Microbacterium sp. T32]KZE41047.1 hypothetical protein AVW09_13160 [Microbacterium sp. T32]